VTLQELCVGLAKCLQVLNISQNKIDALPTEIGSMTELITLNASINQIKMFPVQLSKLHRLSTLNLCHNSLESLSGTDFSAMSALLTLDLSHNKLVDTPGEVGLCSKLRDLNLGDNPFKDKKLIKLIETGKVKNIIQQLQKSAPSKKKEKVILPEIT
jgi:Leucine-rich repeat (LRR) protein